MPNTTTFILRAAILLAFCLTLTGEAAAQRRQSEIDLLKEGDVLRELGLNEQQTAQLDEALKKTRPDTEFFKPFLERIGDARAAKNTEEVTKIQAELNEAVAAKTLELQTEALKILTNFQQKKLRQVFLQSSGMRAFSDARVAAEYGLSPEQTGKLDELNREFRTAERALGAEASDEDRDRLAAEWQPKLEGVLTAEQKTRLDSERTFGQVPAVAGPRPGFPGGPMVPGGPMIPGSPQVPGQPAAVGSFGGDATSSETGERHRITEFRFNFRFETWERVLQMYADGAGLTLDLNEIPPGTFSHYDDNTYTARQTLDILNGYLHRKGYAMIENDGFLIVLNTDNGIPPYLIRDVTEEQLLKVGRELEVGNNELATVRISVDGMETARIATEVEALLGPLGSMVALTDSHLLIITDAGANLRRIHGFLTEAMSKSKPDAQIFKAYHLKNLDAEEAEIQVRTQFGMRQNVANVSMAAEEAARNQARMQSRTQSPPQPGSRTSTPAPSTAAAPEVQIAPDLRLNSLLVTGTAAQHALVESILEVLDVSEAPDGTSLTRDRRGTYLEVYQVKSADSGEVTKTLAAMNIPGVQVVNEDRKTGRVHIMATQRQHEEVAALIRQLDGGGVSGSVAVIPLTQLDPLSAAATLRSLFYSDGTEAPTIECDLLSRRLIIRGSMEQITQIRQVLLDLGEDGTGVRERGVGGNIRRFSLQGRNPEEFLKVLQQQWESQQETKINIVIPSDGGPIKSRRTTEEEIDRPGESLDLEKGTLLDPLSGVSRPRSETLQTQAPDFRKPGTERSLVKSFDHTRHSISQNSVARTDRRPSTENVRSFSMHRRFPGDPKPETTVAAPGQTDRWRYTNAAQVDADDADADSDRGPAAAGQAAPLNGQTWDPNERGRRSVPDEDSEVFIQLLGDELVLSGSDESKLDELEDLLDFLHQSLPIKAEYTVVYLSAADAIEAADMLGQFFPSSSVGTTSAASSGSMFGGLSSSLSSMGSSLMNATGLSGLGSASATLRIIPDVRTNSLFLTGPQSMIRDALAFLRVLDSNEIPESLKDMQPRQIAVQFADVDAVANLLKEVFKPYMEAQGGNRQQQQNPLAMMFGGSGGGGRGGNDESTKVRLTLGVDSQTSILTVNSSQEIFNEVQQVVENMDDAARTARPTVRSIQLRHADPVVIQQMLQSLVPRVSVSSSRSSSGSGSGSGGSTPSPGNSDNNGQRSDNNRGAPNQDAINQEIQNRIRERMQQGGGFPGFPGTGGTSGRGSGNPFSGGRPQGGRGGR
ncbi:MAG: secretin N-terminal domain-containing protein [Planctomycetaceae bacterium]